MYLWCLFICTSYAAGEFHRESEREKKIEIRSLDPTTHRNNFPTIFHSTSKILWSLNHSLLSLPNAKVPSCELSMYYINYILVMQEYNLQSVVYKAVQRTSGSWPLGIYKLWIVQHSKPLSSPRTCAIQNIMS